MQFFVQKIVLSISGISVLVLFLAALLQNSQTCWIALVWLTMSHLPFWIQRYRQYCWRRTKEQLRELKRQQEPVSMNNPWDSALKWLNQENARKQRGFNPGAYRNRP